jgi:WD repeat-containing protein 61
MACWAWSGRSSKVAIRSIPETSEASNENGNGESSGSIGHGPLGGGIGKVIETGKGKFGMDIKFVSFWFFLTLTDLVSGR